LTRVRGRFGRPSRLLWASCRPDLAWSAAYGERVPGTARPGPGATIHGTDLLVDISAGHRRLTGSGWRFQVQLCPRWVQLWHGRMTDGIPGVCVDCCGQRRACGRPQSGRPQSDLSVPPSGRVTSLQCWMRQVTIICSPGRRVSLIRAIVLPRTPSGISSSPSRIGKMRPASRSAAAWVATLLCGTNLFPGQRPSSRFCSSDIWMPIEARVICEIWYHASRKTGPRPGTTGTVAPAGPLPIAT
jgi:hypothetical protein